MVVKNVASPPQIVGITWKIYNLLIKEFPYIEEEKKALMGMIDSFQGLQKWDIPTIFIEEGQIKDLDVWKQGFQDAINVVLNSLATDLAQNDTYHNINDKIMDADLMYHRFTLEAATMPTHITQEAMSKLQGLRAFAWLVDEIDTSHKKYFSLEEDQTEEEE